MSDLFLGAPAPASDAPPAIACTTSPCAPSAAAAVVTLADLTGSIALDSLRKFGSVLSTDHEQAIRDLARALASQLLRARVARVAYPLPCGTGKTETLIALCIAVHRLGLACSLAIAASQVRALCDIKKALLGAGVPESKLGLLHSLRVDNDEIAFPSTGDADRQFMLVTHARVKGATAYPVFLRHRGEARDLMVWDESLVTTETSILSLFEVRHFVPVAVAKLQAKHPDLACAFMEAVAEIEREVQAQGRGAEATVLYPLRGVDIPAAQAALRAIQDRMPFNARGTVDAAKTLLQYAGAPVSLVLGQDGESGDGIIQYSVVVDDRLCNIAVLDASYHIRPLTHRGVEDGATDAMRKCKTFERVAVREFKVGAGKLKLTRDAEAVEDVAGLVAEYVNTLPPNEYVLVYTHLGPDGKFPKRLKGALRGRGIGVDAKVNGIDRFAWDTWGRETSTSKHKCRQHVVAVGVVQRNPLDIAASAAALRGDLLHREDRDALMKLTRSEQAHSLLQLANRGSCRDTVNGKANAMTLAVFGYVPGVKGAVTESMPGVQWYAEQSPRCGSLRQQTMKGIIAALQLDYAEAQDVDYRDLKARVQTRIGLQKIAREPWRAALEDALQNATLGGQWFRSQTGKGLYHSGRLFAGLGLKGVERGVTPIRSPFGEIPPMRPHRCPPA